MHSLFSIVLFEIGFEALCKYHNEKKAFRFIMKSHLGGFIEATAMLGFFFEFGIGTPCIHYALAER